MFSTFVLCLPPPSPPLVVLIFCDGILLCQKCTFTCNGGRRQDVDALWGLCSIACHNDAFIFHIPFNPWRPLYVFLSLSFFHFLIAHFRCMFSLWGRASWPHFFAQNQPERMNFSSIVNTQQIQYRAYFMFTSLLTMASIPLFGTQKGG